MVLEVVYWLDVIRGCDVVVVMFEGRVEEVGVLEELLSSDLVFRVLWES